MPWRPVWLVGVSSRTVVFKLSKPVDGQKTGRNIAEVCGVITQRRTKVHTDLQISALIHS